jgi:hypothetical protein
MLELAEEQQAVDLGSASFKRAFIALLRRVPMDANSLEE